MQLRALKPKDKLHEVNDKGLIILVYPNGTKSFAIRLMVNQNGNAGSWGSTRK